VNIISIIWGLREFSLDIPSMEKAYGNESISSPHLETKPFSMVETQ